MVKRTERIEIMLRPEEKEKLKKMTEKEDLTISEYIRKKIFKD